MCNICLLQRHFVQTVAYSYVIRKIYVASVREGIKGLRYTHTQTHRNIGTLPELNCSLNVKFNFPFVTMYLVLLRDLRQSAFNFFSHAAVISSHCDYDPSGAFKDFDKSYYSWGVAHLLNLYFPEQPFPQSLLTCFSGCMQM